MITNVSFLNNQILSKFKNARKKYIIPICQKNISCFSYYVFDKKPITL